jgi:glycerophosphoryl diester phosphodiesterase
VFSLVLALAFSAAQCGVSGRGISDMKIVGRGGVPSDAPPNTIAGLRKAIELGLDYVEVDLRTTADDKIVDIGSAKVDGRTNGAGLVSSLTCRQLRQLDAGGCFNPKFRDERVPLFGQELALAKGHIRLLVNLRSADPLRVLRLVRQFDMIGDVVFAGDVEALAALQAANAEAQVMPLLSSAKDMAGLAERLHPRYVAGGGALDTAAVKAAHAHGAQYFLDGRGAADNEENILACLRAGVDGLLTDRPRAVLTALKRLGVKRPAPAPGPIAWPAVGERMDSGRTKIIAHRGVAKLAPQNSLEAGALAIEMGLDYIEADVHATADGMIVNIHNDEVDGVTDGHGLVQDLRYADIRKLDAGSWFSPKFKGVHIPLLGEVLAMAKDRAGVYLDWKRGSDPEQLVELLQDFDMTRDVLLHAPDDVCLSVKALDPTVVLMPGADGVDGVREKWERVRPQALEIRWSSFSEEAVRVCHELGMLAMTSHANQRGDTPEGTRRAVLAGMDGFETDEPQMVLEILRELQPRYR